MRSNGHDPAADPETWLGLPVPRREDARLVTGQADYTANARPAGLLHAAFVRSPVASATGVTVDVGAARAAPGVVAVFTAADLDLRDIPATAGRGRPGHPAMTRPPLVRDRIRHVGEPLAVVVAEDAAAAADAVELVAVDFTDAPVVADAAAALAGEPLLFPEAGTNVAHRGAVPRDTPAEGTAAEATAALDRWPIRVTVEVDNQRLAPAPIEPLAFLAMPEPAGDGAAAGLTVRCGHQAPHRLRGQLAMLLGVDPATIRVVSPDVGGAFGMKAMLYPEYPVVAAAARRLERPVRWQQTRYEQFVCGTHGRGSHHRVELAGERDGRIRAARIQVLAEVGAYPHNGSAVPLFSQFMAPGAYDLPDLAVTTTIVVTNRAPTGPYRGAGRPEATYAIERAVDAFARAVGLDPATVRRRNLLRPDQLPHRSATGALYDSGDYPRALDRALELADAGAVREEQAARRPRGADPIGLGMCVFVERTGGEPSSGEYGRVEVTPDGRVVARAGSSAIGQGQETVWGQVVGSALGMHPDLVSVVLGDTAAVAAGTGSFASRSAQLAGSALHRSALQVRAQLRDVAADLLDTPPDALVGVPGGRLAAPDGLFVTLDEVAAHAPQLGVPLAAEEEFSAGAQTFPYGACVAVVEVDRETGRVHLRRLVAVDDCGEVLNPTIVEGQLHGSLLQGVAQALFEGLEYDTLGQLQTSSFATYAVPAASEAPRFTTERLVSPAPSNPLGVKGAGESGCIAAPPAIVNAVLDALAPDGVTDLQMPLTPARVWQALKEARATPSPPRVQ